MPQQFAHDYIFYLLKSDIIIFDQCIVLINDMKVSFCYLLWCSGYKQTLPHQLLLNLKKCSLPFHREPNHFITFPFSRNCARIKHSWISDAWMFECSQLWRQLCKIVCFHFRDLDARAKSERYRTLFRLPKDEKLDGHTDCTLWTPFNKMHILGQMFVSTNYICFTSKEGTVCSLIIPLREVGLGLQEWNSSCFKK